jgi:hypothetical protein
VTVLAERVAFDRGVHLRGTAIWIDPERKRELALLTAVGSRLPPVCSRAVASASVAEMLGRAGYRGSVLPAPPERWVGVGGQEVRFVDTGPGASAVLVALGRDRYLHAGALRREPLEWPEAHHVIVRLPALEHRGGELDQAVTALRLFLATAESDGVAATVLADAMEPALALLEAGLPLAPVGLLARLAGSVEQKRPRFELAVQRAPARKGRVAHLDTGLGRLAGTPDATVRLRWWADGLALAAMVRACRAEGVTVLGLPAARSEALGALLGPSVRLRCLGGAEQLTLAHVR